MREYDAVVVGSGHNGLVAAAYLAKAGKSVLVVERNDYLGGATTSQRIFPEYDAMLSRYSYLVSLFPERIVSELGLRFKTVSRSIASYTPKINDSQSGLLLSNTDSVVSKKSILSLPHGDREWRAYCKWQALLGEMSRLVWPSLLEPLKTKANFKASLRSRQAREAWDGIVENPLGELIERTFANDLIRGLVMTDAKIGVFTHAHDPSLLQNRCFLYHIIGGGTGEWRVPLGGMKSLVDSLVSCCQQQGVKFLLGSNAVCVESNGKSNSVELQGIDSTTTVDAKQVLVNAGPKALAGLMGEKPFGLAQDEGSVVKVNMLLSRLPKLLDHSVDSYSAFCGSLHLSEGYEQMQASYLSACNNQLPMPAPCELYCHSLTDNSILSPDLASRGFHTLTLFGLDMPYRLFSEEHDRKRAQVLANYLHRISEWCGEPIERCIAKNSDGSLCIEVHTPQDLERELGLDQGNIFHNAPSWFYSDEEAGLWGVETKWPGVFRAGSSAVRGGAVSGIPGRNAAMCALAAA